MWKHKFQVNFGGYNLYGRRTASKEEYSTTTSDWLELGDHIIGTDIFQLKITRAMSTSFR